MGVFTGQDGTGVLGVFTGIETEVSPEMKSAVIGGLKAKDRKAAMAGDGVNNAPALADVGVAMSVEADVAIKATGVTLIKVDLTGLVRARKLSHVAIGNIYPNLRQRIVTR